MLVAGAIVFSLAIAIALVTDILLRSSHKKFVEVITDNAKCTEIVNNLLKNTKANAVDAAICGMICLAVVMPDQTSFARYIIYSIKNNYMQFKVLKMFSVCSSSLDWTEHHIWQCYTLYTLTISGPDLKVFCLYSLPTFVVVDTCLFTLVNQQRQLISSFQRQMSTTKLKINRYKILAWSYTTVTFSADVWYMLLYVNCKQILATQKMMTLRNSIVCLLVINKFTP